MVTYVNGEKYKTESIDIEENKLDVLSVNPQKLSKSFENEASVKENGSFAAIKQNKTGKWYDIKLYTKQQQNHEIRLIFRKKISEFLHLTLLKDIVYVNISIGITLALFAEGIFYTLLPMYLYELNISKVAQFFFKSKPY